MICKSCEPGPFRNFLSLQSFDPGSKFSAVALAALSKVERTPIAPSFVALATLLLGDQPQHQQPWVSGLRLGRSHHPAGILDWCS